MYWKDKDPWNDNVLQHLLILLLKALTLHILEILKSNKSELIAKINNLQLSYITANQERSTPKYDVIHSLLVSIFWFYLFEKQMTEFGVWFLIKFQKRLYRDSCKSCTSLHKKEVSGERIHFLPINFIWFAAKKIMTGKKV